MDHEIGPDAAYALRTPDDSRRLYREWATTYDRGFAADQEYRLPFLVSDAFHAAGGRGPVLDVGAGTGLCGERLAKHGIGPVDGADISPEMLERARAKSVYAELFECDLTKRTNLPENRYAGIISSGTFTLGHVGPDAISELIRIALPGALFVLSINQAHFHRADFMEWFRRAAGTIAPPDFPEVAIYGPAADPAHRDDKAYLATFRKL